MVIQKLAGAFFVGCLLAGTANAQSYIRQVEPTPDQLSDNVRGQFIRAGDVSPEEYARLLAEAEKVRAYQSNGYGYDYSYQTETAGVQTATVYDGRPSSTIVNGQGYQIELYDTPITPSSSTIATPVSNSSTTYTASYPSPASNHIVARGDTLYSLSKRYGISLSDLKSANGLYGNTISIGQVLILPRHSTRTYSQSTTITQPLPSGRSTTLVRNVEPIPFSGVYAVLPGDTLYGIARRACVSVDEIVNENSLGGNTIINSGQRLNMPSGHCLQ